MPELAGFDCPNLASLGLLARDIPLSNQELKLDPVASSLELHT
jgi:hypothetical protein